MRKITGAGSASATLALGLLLSACASVGRVDNGVMTMNVSVDRYNNNSTLLNIVRASRQEPLEFTSLTSLTGHNTLTGVVGIPTITLGPHIPGSARDFAFGANSTTKTDSADFNVSVNDDPNSVAALMSPVDPGTLAFFVNQGYDERLILFLFVKSIKVETQRPSREGAQKQLPRYATYINTLTAPSNLPQGTSIVRVPAPTQQDGRALSADDQAKLATLVAFSPFLDEVKYLVSSGMRIEVDKFGLPSARGVPAYRICFDEDYDLAVVPTAPTKPPLSKLACSDPQAGWSGGKPVDTSGAVKTAEDARTDAINALAKAITAANGKSDTSSSKGAGAPQAYWEGGAAADGSQILIETRSVYEVYQYLGQLLDRQIDLRALGSENPGILDIVQGPMAHSQGGCFAAVNDDGIGWCIPNENAARYNMQVFAVLRQIMSLYTAPSAQTNTPTVRAISE